MIEKFTTKVSINTEGEAIRFANECYEVAQDFAIAFAMYTSTHCNCELGNDSLSYREILEAYKKTL